MLFPALWIPFYSAQQGFGMYQIDFNSYRSIKGFNRRVRFLVVHYTAVCFAKSVELLAGAGEVSAHYLIPDPTEQAYIDAGFQDMRIFNLVNESERAWHAGVSYWSGRTNLNDSSIGVEIVNLAFAEAGVVTFPPYHSLQIQALKELLFNILQRYPDIQPTYILGHSDIAPGRKDDPGPAFPWEELYHAGIGAWYDAELKEKYVFQFTAALPAKEQILTKLRQYGYDISAAGTEEGFAKLIRAFQLHFRQTKYDGVLDHETAAILYALIDKYF